VAFPLFLAKLLIHTGIARLLPWVQRLTEGGEAFLPYYSDGLLNAPHGELREVLTLRQGPRGDAIDLATCSPCFDIVPSGSTKLPADRRDSPPVGGLPELRTAVADRLRAANGLVVQPAGEVLITAGVAGAWQLVLDALINAGDRVILFEPASPLYSFALRHRRARIRWVPTWMDNGRLRFEAVRLIEALRGARMVVVNSPANPTGGVLAPEDGELIAWWAQRRDVLIFHDTVFERFRYDADLVSIGSLPRAQDRTLTAGSLSKGHGLGSARVGWLAGHRHLLRPVMLTAALRWAAVPTICQQIALTALGQGEEAFAPIRDDFASRRAYAFERLTGLGLTPDWPAAGYFLWLAVHGLGLDGAQFAAQLARSKQVLVWPGHHFGPSSGGHVRLSFAAEDGRLRQGLARLADFVRQLHATGQPLVERWAA
jgi:aspartate/methionine/tyrosine aminotransferase